ncbi:bifunctional DNA primase/polymerase, partial [Arthrospira platensis SPKY1]|nr:bifunctional DNA primase/polymerase [Arthrospira platensis SPKY1]
MFKIFPCHGKIPLIEKWRESASSDPGQIQLWREQFKDKLTHWGIPTGETNHILALDIDHKSNGYESITKHQIQIPKTLSQRTQNGGQHFIYKYPNGGFTYGNRTNIYPGIDCRGEGGYIVYYN